jgi:ABC-type branched-subunit amino acid transport system substrate-binding protein
MLRLFRSPLALFAGFALLLAGCGETVRQPPPPRLGPQAAAPDVPAKPLPVKIALLLPLSGSDTNLGRAMLEAAQMALFDIGEETLTLLPRDTAGSAANAARAVLEEGAQLVLGPVYSADVQAVAPLARTRSVNVIAFSTDRGVAGNGVYLISSTPEEQVERVMGYAASQGLKRFAVLAPDNAYGTTVIGAAKGAAMRANATDPAVVTYAPNVSTADGLQQALKRLVRGPEPGFDALLIPEGGARLRTIASQFGASNIDPQKVRLLGTALWSGDAELGRDPALVGAWVAGPPPDTLAAFADRFTRFYGRTPPRLAGLAYDAVALAAVLAKAPEPSRFKQEQILNPSGFAGYEGVFRFRRDGVGERALAVMEVQPRGTRVVADAPQGFQAVGQ